MDWSEIGTAMKYVFLLGTTASHTAQNINNCNCVTAESITIGSFPSQSVYELLIKSGVSKQTILTHLAQTGEVKKLDKWVPHELNEKQKQKLLEACLVLDSI
uniref:Uncharacterized protein n=1 Tax=Glossina pallidipes TaxID=7398 RepID=A0A1A9ZAU5_GLOPL